MPYRETDSPEICFPTGQISLKAGRILQIPSRRGRTPAPRGRKRRRYPGMRSRKAAYAAARLFSWPRPSARQADFVFRQIILAGAPFLLLFMAHSDSRQGRLILEWKRAADGPPAAGSSFRCFIPLLLCAGLRWESPAKSLWPDYPGGFLPEAGPPPDSRRFPRKSFWSWSFPWGIPPPVWAPR